MVLEGAIGGERKVIIAMREKSLMHKYLEKGLDVLALVAALAGIFGFISNASAALFAALLLAIGRLIND